MSHVEDVRLIRCVGHDNTPRWREGERLDRIFEAHCLENRDRIAVDTGAELVTYGELDARANRLARRLLREGARPGDRIGLLFDEAVHAYVAMLAVLKVNAAYVPLDPSFPPDRISYITSDASVTRVLTVERLASCLSLSGSGVVLLDPPGPIDPPDPLDPLDPPDPLGLLDGTEDDEDRPLTDEERGTPADELCYIIYTSGSTGRPKGVPIDHASICNFVRVAAEVYGIEADDRVYQGMTIAFDFSVEEIWVPLMAGATLVPKPRGASLVGHELRAFLESRNVTALCCVPTLLATIDDDLPGLRFLLVSGEACPEDLITRWHRPGRRFLNVYGPTETTVTATWSVVDPDRPVTIGVPLPTYSIVILDPERPEALEPGELGEIGIAGIGLARGYLGRDDLTDRAFIPDFLGLPDNPSGRIYRTGDLGRVNPDGEITYHGRIDLQVKIRGYRIELTEIESVLSQVPGIAQAVVSTYEPEPGLVELVAYYTRRGPVDTGELHDLLRQRLPRYMIPAYLEELDQIPMTSSDKADRQRLPPPRNGRSLVVSDATEPANETERGLAEALATALGLPGVGAEAHFFDELGANSLLIAKFCARARERPGLPPISMKDVYLHPTVRDLAAALPNPTAHDLATALPNPTAHDPATTLPNRTVHDPATALPNPTVRDLATAALPTTAPAGAQAAGGTPRVGALSYALCGALQALTYVTYSLVSAVLLDNGLAWALSDHVVIDVYLRTVAAGTGALVALSLLPIAAKWLLVGRWKPGEIRLWSLAYFRFWLVRQLMRFSPMTMFVGTPLYGVYLRAFGAKIGRGTLILSRRQPVCADLITIGEGTVIRKEAVFTGYRAEAGRIVTGPVTIGREAFVGELTAIDINTSMGDRTQLGHSSALHPGQSIPDGEHWHGSPAQPTTADFQRVPAARCGRPSRIRFSLIQAVLLVGFTIPLGLAVGEGGDALLQSQSTSATQWIFYPEELADTFVLYFGLVLTGLLLVLTLPRLLNLVITPDRTYPLYGLHHTLHRTISRLTNVKTYTNLFGDSAYITGYLTLLGYDLHKVVQTGSNFGVEVTHESPFLCSIGSGTMVSDGLSLMNAEYSSTSFRLRRSAIGKRNFLGNAISYPADGRTGENCLLGTKVAVPIDGPVRENVGLLGSPCFEIPRTVERDSGFEHLSTGDALVRNLAAKKRYNTRTIGVYLLVMWLHFFGVILIGLGADAGYRRFGSLAVAVGLLGIMAFSTVYHVVVERACYRFRALQPQFCSIYDPRFWLHERFWKLNTASFLALYDGTPFKGLAWRMLGVKVGRRLFDDGCAIPERSLVSIGDDCSLNVSTCVQGHSLEDGVFKSDRVRIGDRCMVGPHAFVHYGVTMADDTVVETDAFLMKGTETAAGSRWRGNPATEI